MSELLGIIYFLKLLNEKILIHSLTVGKTLLVPILLQILHTYQWGPSQSSSVQNKRDTPFQPKIPQYHTENPSFQQTPLFHTPLSSTKNSFI